MEFGTFLRATVGPRPWGESEASRFRREIELGVAAEKAGFDAVWAPEHHCLEEYSHCSASHLICLAVGMLTQKIRLITGIFNLCPPINHPVRVAEQIATIDILTHGRIELGTGRGSGSTEVNTFGISNEESREMWDEAVRAIPRMWTQDLFSHQGKYFSVPERCILPKPVQRPHPPLWVTASNPNTVETAARMGLGVAVFSFSGPDVIRPLVDRYKETIEKAEPISDVVNNKIMTLGHGLCLDDGDEARRIYRTTPDNGPYFSVYFDTIPDVAERLEHEPRPIPQTRLRELVHEAKQATDIVRPTTRGVFTREELAANGVCVGNPEEVSATIQRYRDIGIDQLVLTPPMRNAPQEVSLESMRILGEKVFPNFR